MQEVRSSCLLALVMLALLASSATCRAEDPKAATSNTQAKDTIAVEKIETIARQLVADGDTSAISVGIQVRDQPPRTHAFGIVNRRAGRQAQVNDGYRIASVTKLITAAAVLRLVDAQKLSLDASLAEFFPEYPDGANITVRQLLSHTSGVAGWHEGGLPPETPADFPMCPEPHRYLQRMTVPAVFKPGEFYGYSNSGYVLLGEIIERVSGQSYEAFLAKEIYASAGMTHTQLEYIERPHPNWAQGYSRKAAHEFGDPRPDFKSFAAGDLRSTAADMLSFMHALFAGRIVSEDSLRLMTSYGRVNDGRPTYAAKFVSGGASPPENKTKVGHGLGFRLMNLGGAPVYDHPGGHSGFASYVLHVPHSGVTVVLLANTESAIESRHVDILKIALGLP